MRITWDDRKNRSNIAKHKLSFETASLAFEDPRALSLLDRVVHGEERWQTVGLAGGIAVVLVAHTWHEQDGEELIHIISARKATPSERNRYEEAL
jgi:uncharacterized DUF497 family protein